ncbi:MAG: sulfite exporter TauE/SafE family protein [Candidatus Omnitrophica bacterium]|nr:sulfite exporter TauE/SafE family protein [Candidatus Omnitrophota bacterium]
MNPSGNPIDYLFAFFGGVLISFTPCIYPLIPVSAGYITFRSGASKFKAFILSLFYVSGIAITYSILGLIAALTGSFFGRISTHYLTYFIVGIIIFLFGIMMWFGLFNFSFRGLAGIKEKSNGYFSTFVLGITSGFIASPCLTPVLGSILAYIATKKNLFFGMGLLMSFAYGMGLILILSGTFASILINLPKSGKWMLYAKKIVSLILLAAGLYFIWTGVRRI